MVGQLLHRLQVIKGRDAGKMFQTSMKGGGPLEFRQFLLGREDSLDSNRRPPGPEALSQYHSGMIIGEKYSGPAFGRLQFTGIWREVKVLFREVYRAHCRSMAQAID